LRSIKQFLQANKKDILLVGCLFTLQIIMYFVSNRLLYEYHIIHVDFDDLIPYCPVFIVFYILWFPYIPVSLIFGLRQSPALFRRQITNLFLGNLLCFVIFLSYPSAIDFRPTPQGSDIFSWLCRFIYSCDRPVNVLPSLHCLHALSIYMTTFCSSPLGKHRRWRLFSLLLCILICLSTVFVKQHSILDAILGCLIAIFLYCITKQPIFRRFYDRTV